MLAPPPPGFYDRHPAFRGDPAGDPRVWLDFEGLVWWSRSQPLSVPVVTTGPASQGANAGGLGVPGTVSLNRALNYGAFGGVRVAVGGWVEPSHTWGLEGDLLSLGRNSTGFGVTDRAGDGSMVINEPVAGAPYSTQVSAPGVETGSVFVRTDSQFWGAGVNGLFNLVRTGGLTLSVSAGFRYLDLEEHLNVTSNSALFTTTTYTDNLGNTLATAPPGSTVTVVDQFGARNQFYGGQVGVRAQYMLNRWSFNGQTTLALGATHEVVSVNGFTNVYPANGSPVYLNGGNYASIQNGVYVANKFAVAPALQLNVGYQITPWVRATVGYNLLFLSSVVRPGNQIDNTYDGVTHPLVPMKSTTYWTQGLTFGLRASF
jgi:hypothetical protein